MLQIPEEKMIIYRAAARARSQAKERKLKLMYNSGWELARAAAQLLKNEFAVDRVVIFGSMLDQKRIHLHSDIDLVAWGIPDRLYYRAVSRILDINPEIPVDLLQGEYLPEYLLTVIKQQGVELL